MSGEKKALIAMSGGVDSSVAALIMKQRGYSCIGATMKLYNNDDAAVSAAKTCCSADDISDARRVCDKLEIPFYVFNFREEFKSKVIDKFVHEYECGATPNPCIDCNRYMKFDKFLHRAEEIDCDCVVTGHYARIEHENGRYVLKRAVDLSKDQSYVLYSMTQNQLAHTIFPLGDMTKTQTRSIAEQSGLVNARKHDSQDICFVPNGDYAAVIENYTGKKYPCGNFVSKDGRILGQHNGIIRYTIGQRRGLGIALGEPMYVAKKDVQTNDVVLCTNSELFSDTLVAHDFNWILYDNPPKHFEAKAKIRYNQTEQPAAVDVLDDGKVRITFENPQRAVAKGQAVVIYKEDTVVGGGTIWE